MAMSREGDWRPPWIIAVIGVAGLGLMLIARRDTVWLW